MTSHSHPCSFPITKGRLSSGFNNLCNISHIPLDMSFLPNATKLARLDPHMWGGTGKEELFDTKDCAVYDSDWTGHVEIH